MSNIVKADIYNLSFQDVSCLLRYTKSNDVLLEDAFKSVQSLLKCSGWIDLVGDRFSWYLIRGLMELKLRKEFFGEVINEIQHLENPIVNASITKEQKKFKYQPLKGLWHKHYHLSNLDNFKHLIINPLLKPKKWNRVKEELINREKQIGSRDRNIGMVLSILKEFTIDVYDSKTTRCELTGEWIIYHEYNGQNYYLGLWNHLDDEAKIAGDIDRIFKDEFAQFTLPVSS